MLDRIRDGESPDSTEIERLAPAEREQVVERLLGDPSGRRWLRANVELDSGLAARLLEHVEDFQTRRRDRTLAAVIEAAPLDAVRGHLAAIASGPAAAALWSRLAGDPALLVELASKLASTGDEPLARTTLSLLLFDPLEGHGLSDDQRAGIALAGLDSPHASVRGIAADHLARADPVALAERLDDLLSDEDQQVRGHVWSAAYGTQRELARERAIALLGDETAPVEIRRSALLATGEHVPTGEVVELLAYFVIHPNEDLALDAANLLHRLHRQPEIAMAALSSPHEQVREIAAHLMDPYRGSPAAGGSRPGDPTRTDAYAQMLRQLQDEHDKETGN